MPTLAPTGSSPEKGPPSAGGDGPWPNPPLPKAPVLGWRSFARATGEPSPALPHVFELPHRKYLTSGRAALLAALRQLDLPLGSGVLVPTYHCPTMVAPILKAGLEPLYFPIGNDGLPMLDAIDPQQAGRARAMFVAHYFGLPKGLQDSLQWCRQRGIALVEDCAHSYFGQAGSRPVGTWGDFATASLSKFFPVPEAGLLASATRALKPLNLRAAGARAQTKGFVDLLEHSHRHGHLAGVREAVGPMLWLKNFRRTDSHPGSVRPQAQGCVDAMMTGCDMARAEQEPSWAAQMVHKALPLARIVAARRRNYAALVEGLRDAVHARPLNPGLPDSAAPYVCPVWVDGGPRADEVYARLRNAGLPVFRWDQIWPGTPAELHDTGPQWSRHVLQFLCHQDLSQADIARVLSTTRHILQAI